MKSLCNYMFRKLYQEIRIFHRIRKEEGEPCMEQHMHNAAILCATQVSDLDSLLKLEQPMFSPRLLLNWSILNFI